MYTDCRKCNLKCLADYLTQRWRIGTQSVKLPCNIWCSRENRSRLSMAKVLTAQMISIFEVLKLFRCMEWQLVIFSYEPSSRMSECCESWRSPFNIHITLSNSKNIRTQCCVKCRTGTLRPRASLSGDQLKSPTPQKKSVLGDESESSLEVQGQRWIQGLINHKSVWIQRFRSPHEYTFLLEKHNSQTSGLELSYHVPEEP